MISDRLFAWLTILVGLACADASASGRYDVPMPMANYAAGKQPGCAMGVFGPGGKVRLAASGYPRLDAENRINEHTPFLIASMSKQFTALALMMLVQDGKLALDHRADRWVPELAAAVQDASIAELLHHTAGVRDHVNLILLSGTEQLAGVSLEETMALMARQKRTNFAPGSRSQYSNGNYFVLAQIVERVSGESLAAFARGRLFEPLGMSQTTYVESEPVPGIATGYQPDGSPDGYREANDRPATHGSGGVVTTVHDLARFHNDFRTRRRVWRPEVAAAMLTPGRLRNGEVSIVPELEVPYGLGLGLAQEGANLRVFHDGGAEGFRAEYVRSADGTVGVAVLCNRIDARAPAIADAVFRLESGWQAPADERTPSIPSTLLEPSPAPNALLDALAGTYYAEELDAIYTLVVLGGGYSVQISSPLNRGLDHSETWGSLTMTTEGTLVSGPLMLTYTTEAGVPRLTTLGLGRRVEGLLLKRQAARGDGPSLAGR